MESINVTDEQRLYLQAIFDYFREYGKWPTHTYLERQFIQTHPDLDIEEIAQSLPAGLTNPVDLLNTESKATLSVPAIYQCWGSVQELSTFVSVIEICVKIFFKTGIETRSLSNADLARDNPIWRENAIRKVGLLLYGEPNIWSTFAGPDQEGGWSCVIAKEIRRFRGVNTIEQYLEMRIMPRKELSQPVVPVMSTPTVVSANDLQLHSDILSRCWDLFIAQKYDDAILNATKALEVAIRTKTHLSHDIIGATLVNRAFKPDKPILRYSDIEAEQEGMMSLLRGMIQVFKNPQSHRFVGVQNKSECLSVLLMCSNLLYTIENVEYVG
jgi:uncharacterized protein (TIGR02391 family)